MLDRRVAVLPGVPGNVKAKPIDRNLPLVKDQIEYDLRRYALPGKHGDQFSLCQHLRHELERRNGETDVAL